MSDFKWQTEDADSVCIQSVDAIAVYTNERGDIVIRQEDRMGGEDSVIAIPRMHAQAVLDAILNEMKNS